MRNMAEYYSINAGHHFVFATYITAYRNFWLAKPGTSQAVDAETRLKERCKQFNNVYRHQLLPRQRFFREKLQRDEGTSYTLVDAMHDYCRTNQNTLFHDYVLCQGSRRFIGVERAEYLHHPGNPDSQEVWEVVIGFA